MLPRIKRISLIDGSDLYLIQLTDWRDAVFATTAFIFYSGNHGAYCLAETANKLDEYSQLLFPGFSTTYFDEISWSRERVSNV